MAAMVRKRLNPVRGVGVNDADYAVTVHNFIEGKWVKVWTCPFYKTWAKMLERGYSISHKQIFPTYKDVTVCQEWLKFSVFKKWMEQQDWVYKQLDKDLLVDGNKVYSPETCVFISRELNLFLIYRKHANKSGYPGVSWSAVSSKWVAYICNPFLHTYESLGYFNSAEEAYKVWRKRKHQFALIYAERETDERIKKALRSRFNTE